MSVLRPFVYDLVALNRNYNKKHAGAELTDPKALNDIRRIDERLQGYEVYDSYGSRFYNFKEKTAKIKFYLV